MNKRRLEKYRKDVTLCVQSVVILIRIEKYITVEGLNLFNPLREYFIDIVNPPVVLVLK